MQRNVVWLAVLVMAASVAMYAGDVKGKVGGVSGVSVVWINAIPGKTFPPEAKHPVMNQKGLMFRPHIMAITVGTTVEFLNSDSVQHNVFWPSISGNRKLGHNMGTWPQGVSKPFKFDQPGIVPLLCNVHPDMSGYIIISPTPYYAETDASGNFTVTGVPDGKYTMTAWHEGAKTQSKPVTVPGGASVDFTLSK
jgi:plastocyanin